MGCKFKYKDKIYESEADLKAVLRQELKEGTAKVRDSDLLTHPVTKIISGAQTGVDMAGLDAAFELGIPTGGTMAARFQQSVEGDNKIFSPQVAKKFGLKEGKVTLRQGKYGSYEDVYYQRTIDNAQEADGTIWFGNAESPGGKLTLGRDAQKGKPSPLINPTSAQEIRNWLNENNIKILNVAGNREHTNPGIYDKAKTLLIEALKQATQPTTNTTTQQPIVDEITIQKMAEIMKEIYPEVDVTTVTKQSQFAQESNRVFNQRIAEQDDTLPEGVSFERVEAVSNMIMNKLAILGKPLTKRDFNKAKVDIFYKNDTAIKNDLYMEMLTNILDSSFASRVEGVDPDAALENILNEDLKGSIKSRLEELTNNNPYVRNKEALDELKQNYRLLESFMKHKDINAIDKYDEEQQKVVRLYLSEVFSPTKSMNFKTEKQKLVFLGTNILKKMKMQIRTKESNLYNLMFRMRALTKKYETLIDFFDIVPNYKELITDKLNNAYDRIIAYKNKNIADEKTNLRRNILFKAIYNEATFMQQEFKLNNAAKNLPKKKNVSVLFPELVDQNTVTSDVVTTLQRIVDGNGKFSALAASLLPFAEKNNIKLTITDEYTGSENTAAHYLVRTAQVVDKNTKEFLNDTVIDQYIEVNLNSAAATVQPEQLILHETVHSLTTIAIASTTFAKNPAYTKLLDYIVKSINEHDVKTGGFMAMFSTPYGIVNPDELFAEALTNSEFQEVLKSIPPMDKKQFRNLFEEIVDFIASLFNIKEYSNVYEQLEEVIYATMSNQSEFAFSLEQLSKELDKNIDELEVVLKAGHNDRDMKQLNIQNQKKGNNVFNQESSIVTYQDEDDDGNITNNTLKLSDVKLNVINNGVLGDRELTYQIIDSSTNKLLGRVRVNKKEGTNYYQIGNIALFPSIKISEEEYNSFMAQLIHRLSTIFRDAISGFRKRTLIGKGVGKQVYSELNKELQEYELISDDTRSHNAEMMWQSLERKGLAEKIQFKGDTIYKYKKNAGIPIKEGVQELFESNSELVNEVYEALGFNNNVVFETERGSVYYLNNGKTKRDKKTSTGRIEKFSESDKTVYITEEDFKTLRENSEGIKDLEWSNNSVTVTNDFNRKTTISVSNTPKIGLLPLELVKGIDETETGYREDKRINIKSYSFLPNGVSFHAGHKIVSINPQITPQQKQQAISIYSQYLESLNKPNTNPILQGNQQEQAKKFAELQERLNNKEFLEGAKNAFESSEELQQFGTQEQYNDFIARVSLGIIKNPSSGEYNYTSQVKDIVYHGTNLNFEKFDKEIEWINNQIDEGVIIEKYPYTNKEDKTDKIGIEAVKDLRIQKINKDKQHYLDAQKDTTSTINFYENTVTNILHKQFGKENVKQITDEYDNTWNELSINQARDLSNVLLQKNRKGQIVGQAQFDPNASFMAGKVLIDYINGTVDTVPHEYAHLYIAWFRNTPLVQEAIRQWGSEEALVQAIGEQAVVQRGKAWTWWKKFVAWLLNSANELSDLSKENLRDILTDAFLSRQDITATLNGIVYSKDQVNGEWAPVDLDIEFPIVYPSDKAFKAALDAEQAAKVKNDAMIKPAWKNNKRAALENRLLDMHKAIALHPVNAQNLLAPVSTAITKGIVEKLGIRAKHATRSAVIDPLSNINASIAMVQGKQGVGIVANAINTKAVLTGVDAKLTPMYPVQSPLSNDEKHTQLPINLRMLGIEKVRYADGTLAYSLGKLVDTFGNSIISNLSESLTQQVDNVKDPVAVELGYTLKTLGLTSYILTLGVPQEVLAGLTAKGGVVTAWNDRVEENENLFHKGVTEESFEVIEYTGEPRKISTRFEESNSTLKVEFINNLLRKEGVPSKYIETVVDNNGRPKGHILKHEALDIDNVSLDKYDAVKLLFYWELIDQARAYGNTIKALTADTKTHKSIDAAAQQQLLINQQLQGVESIVDKDDIAKVISSRAALKSNTKSVISPFFNMQRKYDEYFSKYFYTHENGISSYLAASLKARYKLYSGDKLNRLISTAHNDFMIYLMTRMTAVNPNATSSLAKFNNANAPLVGVDALLKHREGLKMSAVNSIYNNLTLISKQPNITASRAYYYAQPSTPRNNNITALYQNITPEMARSLLDIFRFELGRVIKADVNIDNNVSIYLQNISSIDLIMFKDSAITTSAANNYIEIFEELRILSPGLIQLFNSISLFQAGLNNSPYNLFKTLPITDLLAEDKSKSLVSNLATTIRTFDKLLPKKGVEHSAEADKRSAAIYDMVDDFLRWFDLQYGKIYVQPEAASKYNKASMLYRKFDPTQQKFLIYVKSDAGGDGNPLASVSSLTKNYLSAVPYTYTPTTTAETSSNVITNATINEDATVAQLKTLGSLGDIIKSYVAAGGDIETLCS